MELYQYGSKTHFRTPPGTNGPVRGLPREGQPGRPRPEMGAPGAAEHRALPNGPIQRDASDHARPEQACPGDAAQRVGARGFHPSRGTGSKLHAVGTDREGGRCPSHPDDAGSIRVQMVRRGSVRGPETPTLERRVRRLVYPQDDASHDRRRSTVTVVPGGNRTETPRTLVNRPRSRVHGGFSPRWVNPIGSYLVS